MFRGNRIKFQILKNAYLRARCADAMHDRFARIFRKWNRKSASFACECSVSLLVREPNATTLSSSKMKFYVSRCIKVSICATVLGLCGIICYKGRARGEFHRTGPLHDIEKRIKRDLKLKYKVYGYRPEPRSFQSFISMDMNGIGGKN